MTIWGRLARQSLIGVLVLLWVVLVAFGYGISSADAHRLQAFAQTVERSCVNPDFRRVAMAYCQAGSQALQTRLLGMPSGRLLYTLRRTPGLPVRYAASEHLALHYAHFAEGPLSAYLHLSGRQDVADGIALLQAMDSSPPSDEQAMRFLQAWEVWPAVCTDDGALASVRRLWADVQPDRPFALRQSVEHLLQAQVGHLAERQGYPPQPRDMSAAQQQKLLDLLDDYVRQTDLQLWRTKQVSDFLCGIWGQTFGRSYAVVARFVLVFRRIAQVGAPAMLIGLLGFWRPAHRKGYCVLGAGICNGGQSLPDRPGLP